MIETMTGNHLLSVQIMILDQFHKQNSNAKNSDMLSDVCFDFNFHNHFQIARKIMKIGYSFFEKHTAACFFFGNKR